MELQYFKDRGMGLYVSSTLEINQFRIGMAVLLIFVYSNSKFIVICKNIRLEIALHLGAY